MTKARDITWNGLPVRIEVERGDVRSGKSKDGDTWSVTMPCGYGCFPGTKGQDGEDIDVFVGPDLKSDAVFAINQIAPETGKFDEQKVMIGFKNPDEAAKHYVRSFSDGKGKDRIGKMMQVRLPAFMSQLKDLAIRKGFAAGGSAGLVVVTSPSGAKFRVAEQHGPKFEALVRDLEDAGYSIDGNTSGGYNYRTIAGSNKLSNHAHGAAIDINWSDNARGSKGTLDPELARSLAKKHGLAWGGDWKNPDPMHFEVPGASPLPQGHHHGDGHDHGETRGQSRSVASFSGGELFGDVAPGPEPIAEGGVSPAMGQAILKAVRSWGDGDDAPSRSIAMARLSGGGGSSRVSEGSMPYGGTLKGWLGMPYGGGREQMADGGMAGEAGLNAREPIVHGPLKSHMGAGGRTDTLPITVAPGSFVFPADTVSALGENDTDHGFRVLDQMFAQARKLDDLPASMRPNIEVPDTSGVPIVAAAGEYVAPPEVVAWVGDGDLDAGHRVLEKLVLRVRKDHIDELKRLPRPHR